MRLESHLGKDADENGPFAGLILYESLKQEGGFDSYVKYSNDVPYGSPAKLVERIGQEPIQDGGMGGYGGGLRAFGHEASVEAPAGRGKSASASRSVTTSLSQGNADPPSGAIPARADGSASVSASVDSVTSPSAPMSCVGNPQIPDGMKERGYAKACG